MHPLESITRAVCATHSAATPSLSSSATPPVDGSEGKGAEVREHYRKARDLFSALALHLAERDPSSQSERDNMHEVCGCLDAALTWILDAEASALEPRK